MNSACNGCRPKSLGQRKRYDRPRLMKKMMGERQVARFLVAPTGYGKSTLLLEYADSIFGLHNVYWIDCQSPCFLRDLDAAAIVETLVQMGSPQSLAVFEDVPYLDDARAEAFSACVDALLSAGWEVVASMLPPFDSYSERQGDRVLLEADDFLADDAELEALRGASDGAMTRRVDRVCALAWGDDDDRGAFVDGLRAMELPAEMRLAMLVMLVLQEGSFEDLSALVRGIKRDTLRFLARHYPHLGIDLVAEGFDAVRLPVERLARAYANSIDSAVERAGYVGRDALAARLADLLVERGAYRRACETMKALCARKRRISWIERSHAGFMAAGQLAPLQDLFESLGKRPAGLSPRALLDAAMRLRILGDAQAAAGFASRAMAHPDSSACNVCEAALLCEECGNDDQRARALRALKRIAARRDSSDEQGRGDSEAFRRLAASCLALRDDPLKALAALTPVACELAGEEAALAHIAVLLAHANGRIVRKEWAPWTRAQRDAAVRLALEVVRGGERQATVLEAVVASEIAAASGYTVGDEAWRISADERVVGLSTQRAEWATRMRRDMAMAIPRHRAVDDEELRRRVPEMRVRLFGGMEVRVGGRMVDPGSFRKQKAKTLLAVLVLHRGREVPRRDLVDILWPSSRSERGVSNFYSVWSVLRKALSDEEGLCPYLVRHQTSCMVDSRFVHSDIEEFEDLYRRLMFDPPDARAWMGVFERLSAGFFCDLLPSETDNLYIVGMRERFRSRTVDACATAAGRLCDAREPQTALWFANAALELDRGREDVYYALMRAQMMAGRRTSAMETYFACLRFMGDELGMSPSERIVRLYDELLVCAESE